jgi:translation initiation factor IF-2
LDEKKNQKDIHDAPKFVEVGTARTLKIFNFSGTIVIGAVVTTGKIKIGDDIMGSKVVSLKVNKSDVDEVKKDQEFGLVLKPQVELHEGDILSATNPIN